MAKMQLKQGGNGGEGQSYEAYPADTYYCEIVQFEHKLSNFKDDRTGEDKFEFEVTWEVYQLTPDQDEAGLTTGKWFRQWFSEFYGPTKNGDSKFKVFVDGLRAQGYLKEFDPNDFDTDDMIGIRQKVTVTEATKKDGTPVNKVTGVTPLKPQRRAAAAPQAAQPAPARPAKAAPRNVPEPVAVGAEDGEELF